MRVAVDILNCSNTYYALNIYYFPLEMDSEKCGWDQGEAENRECKYGDEHEDIDENEVESKVCIYLEGNRKSLNNLDFCRKEEGRDGKDDENKEPNSEVDVSDESDVSVGSWEYVQEGVEPSTLLEYQSQPCFNKRGVIHTTRLGPEV